MFISDHSQCFHTNRSPSRSRPRSSLRQHPADPSVNSLQGGVYRLALNSLPACFPGVFLLLLTPETPPLPGAALLGGLALLSPAPANCSCVPSPSCHHQAPISSPGLCTGLFLPLDGVRLRQPGRLPFTETLLKPLVSAWLWLGPEPGVGSGLEGLGGNSQVISASPGAEVLSTSLLPESTAS